MYVRYKQNKVEQSCYDSSSAVIFPSDSSSAVRFPSDSSSAVRFPSDSSAFN